METIPRPEEGLHPPGEKLMTVLQGPAWGPVEDRAVLSTVLRSLMGRREQLPFL